MLELNEMTQDDMLVVEGGRNMNCGDGASVPPTSKQGEWKMKESVPSSGVKVVREIIRIVTGK